MIQREVGDLQRRCGIYVGFIGIFMVLLIGMVSAADVAPVGPWGESGDLPIAGDFNGDGIPGEIGVFRPSTQTWYFDTNLDGRTDRTLRGWGRTGDKPLAGDFDRDGIRGDIATFTPSEGKWTYKINADPDVTDRVVTGWGIAGDLPLAGDFNNDGKFDDVAVYRPSTKTWYFDIGANGDTDAKKGPWGASQDIPSNNAANIDEPRNGKVNDVALFRGTGTDWKWFISYNNKCDRTDYRFKWGASGDLPTSGDFDHDGFSDDFALFKPTTRMWSFITTISAPAF